MYVELKRPAEHAAAGQDLAAAVLRELAAHGYATRTDRCFVQCFDLDELARVRHDLGCDLKLTFLTKTDPGWTDGQWAEAAALLDGFGRRSPRC